MDSPVVATLRLSYVGRRATRQTTGGAEGATSRHHASDLGAPLGGHVRAVEGARRSAADVASRRHCEGLRRTRTIAQPSRTAPAHALQKARREPGTRLLVAYRRGLPHVPVGLPRRPRSKLTTGVHRGPSWSPHQSNRSSTRCRKEFATLLSPGASMTSGSKNATAPRSALSSSVCSAHTCVPHASGIRVHGSRQSCWTASRCRTPAWRRSPEPPSGVDAMAGSSIRWPRGSSSQRIANG